MKISRMFILAALVGSLFAALGVSADAESGGVEVYSAAPCKDTTTIAVSGWSTYRNNRIHAAIRYHDGDGKEVLLREVYTAAFDAGQFFMAITLPYEKRAVPAGTVMWVDVQLQRHSGNVYLNLGPTARAWLTAADKSCSGLCSATIDATDMAPADGTITLRSHYGTWFRPEGRLQGAIPVSAGRKARITFVGLDCGWTVRAWYYPKSGDTTPRMLPAQYWPGEYQVTDADGTNPYTTSFASGLRPTDPLEEDDPYVVR